MDYKDRKITLSIPLTTYMRLRKHKNKKREAKYKVIERLLDFYEANYTNKLEEWIKNLKTER